MNEAADHDQNKLSGIGSRPGGSADSPTAQLGASGPARTGCLPFTRRPLSLVSYEGIVSEPPSGADPDRPPYEGGAAAVRGGMAPTVPSCEDAARLLGSLGAGSAAGIPGFEPGKLRDQNPAGLPVPPYPIACERRDSNPHLHEV